MFCFTVKKQLEIVFLQGKQNLIIHIFANTGEETLTRQLIGLHRAVTHKDKNLLNQIVKQGTEMSLPLRGVTALSLSLYLRHMEMTSELLAALRKTKQLGKFSRYFDTCSK